MVGNFKMNLEIKRMWIEALRSGKYKQGKNYLKQYDNFCCMGVLCDLYLTANSIIGWVPRNNGHNTYFNEHNTYHFYNDKTDGLPDDVMKWSGIPINNPLLKISDILGQEYSTMSQVNDHYGFSFNRIADMIEEQL